tara:strand:+ start:251 stop:763 length:513 start_codon:yes stop_codon:yes gene_type:complete
MSFTESNSLYSYAATDGIAGVSYAFGPSIAATGLMKTLFGASTFLLSFASYAVIPVLALATYAAYNYFTAKPESTIDQDISRHYNAFNETMNMEELVQDEKAHTVTAKEKHDSSYDKDISRHYNAFNAEPESTIDQDERANTVTAEERRNNPDYFYYFYFDEQRVKSLGR